MESVRKENHEKQPKRNGVKPPVELNRMVYGVECQYNYLKTVHFLQELDDLRLEHQCCFPNKRKSANNFKFIQLRCIKVRNPAKGKSSCPFALLAWRPGPDRKQIHIYATSTKHNHHIEHAAPYDVTWPEEREPEESFIAKGRKWTFLETARNADELNAIRRDKFHCGCNKIKANQCRITMQCMYSNGREGCAFKLLAQKTDRGRFHIYGSDEHTCSYQNYELNKTVQLSAEDPPGNISTLDGREWKFLETKEIEMGKKLVKKICLIARKYNCHCTNVEKLRKKCTLRKLQMYCTCMGSSKCAFRLLLQYTDCADRYHLYGSGKHTCKHQNAEPTIAAVDEENEENLTSSDEEEEEEEEAASIKLQNDGKPPLAFTRVYRRVKRHYSFLKTVHSMQELDKCRIEHQCVLQNSGRKTIYKRPGSKYARMHCQKIYDKKCQFALLAWRPTPKSSDIHVYTAQNEQHNHAVKTADKRVMYRVPHKELLPDADPPTKFTTPNGREWTFLETAETPAELERIQKRKYHCSNGTVQGLDKGRCRKTMYCYNKNMKNNLRCPFALFAQKSDLGRFHLYSSGQHTCSFNKGNKGESVVLWRELLPDAHPPNTFATSTDGREWSFLETVEMKEKLTDQLINFKRKYRCLYASKNTAMKHKDWRQSINMMTFRCTTRSTTQVSRMCPFKLMARKTDRGRLHIYGSKKHTCQHRMILKRMKGDEREEEEESDEEIDEKEDDREKEEMDEYDEEEKEEEIDIEDYDENEKEDEDDEINEEEQDEEDCENEKEYERKVKMNFEEEEDDEGDDDEGKENNDEEGSDEDEKDDDKLVEVDESDQEDLLILNAPRTRSPTVPHEMNDVQFVDFVDHPKCEGVKMRRLGEQKKEPTTNAVMITMDEEVANLWQKTKMPKQEIVKEETHECQPDPSNKNGQKAVPAAAINRQNQQTAAMVRERWWANPAIGNGAESGSNQKRMLRERKHHINYRE